MVKTVAILYSDAKRSDFPTEELYITEMGVIEEARVVSKYLEKVGVKADLYPANSESVLSLCNNKKIELVINLADSIRGSEALSAAIPALLEMFKIPYTGSDMFGKALDCNKFLTNQWLRQHGVLVPNFQLFNTPDDALNSGLRFPLISKLNEVHGGVEIDEDAVSPEMKHLRRRLKRFFETYNQPVIVQEFIVGEEAIAILLDVKSEQEVYMVEKVFNSGNNKYSITLFSDQWADYQGTSISYKKYKNETLTEGVKKAFSACDMRDYGKFDIRINNHGECYFIDVNCNPAFGPKENDCAMGIILEMYGIEFADFLSDFVNKKR